MRKKRMILLMSWSPELKKEFFLFPEKMPAKFETDETGPSGLGRGVAATGPRGDSETRTEDVGEAVGLKKEGRRRGHEPSLLRQRP